MIEIKGLSKSFGENTVFEEVNLTVETGEVVAIIGPSGTGKSTLLRCLNLLETPNSGYLVIDGTTIDLAHVQPTDARKIRERLPMVFQSANLYRNKTAIENIMEPLLVVKKLSKTDAYTRAEELLKRVGVYHRKDSYPITLSGGEQQRVGIARAMGMESDVILFDEPTSALDPTLVGEVLKVIRDLANQKTTMMIVTHEMKFAREIADKVVFMSGGKITEMGTAEDIFLNAKEPATRSFIGGLNY